MESRWRSHNCGELRIDDKSKSVSLCGWVHRIRDHGGLLFVDLRDHYGIIQCVFHPGSKVFDQASAVKPEWVVRVDGEVVARTEDTVNSSIETGEIEITAEEIRVINSFDELPLPVFDEPDYPEDIRLKYRFLDLRRKSIKNRMVTRSKIIHHMRSWMIEHDFLELETPLLTASSPEGARDYLVPSRLQPSMFYALPQAPQQFKQILMASGFDRYMQFAKCFRDEDPRSDRLCGDFLQLDLEMAFAEQCDVFDIVEPLVYGTTATFSEYKRIPKHPFPRISYKESMQKYGTDKPDLRNPIEMSDVTEHFRGSGFGLFANMIDNDTNVKVWAIPAITGGSRAFCDSMDKWSKEEAGQKGLGYIFYREGNEGAGPIAKNIGAERTEALRTELGLINGDAVFFCAGVPYDFRDFAGKARDKIGEKLKLINKDEFMFVWITDFPMFEYDPDLKKLKFGHNPFSMPQNADDNPMVMKAFQYDLVLNGYEIGSGAVRVHNADMLRSMFKIVGHDASYVDDNFPGLIRALSYGAPPHAGMALGVDRLVMLLTGAENLREVVLFPLNGQGQDLLMGAPSEIDEKLLKESGLKKISTMNQN